MTRETISMQRDGDVKHSMIQRSDGKWRDVSIQIMTATMSMTVAAWQPAVAPTSRGPTPTIETIINKPSMASTVWRNY